MTILAALVGYGTAGKTFHAPLIEATEGLSLNWVVSSDPEKVHADLPDVGVFAELEHALAEPDLDLVVLATPNHLHAPQAAAALAAGKHVVIDKPFALSHAEAVDLAAQAEEANLLLTVFHNRRWDSEFLTLRKLIAIGALGEITHFESHFDRWRPEVLHRWKEGGVPGSGAWFDLGPHLIDQALLLLGWPDAIFADIASQRPGVSAPDWFHVELRYGPRRAVLQSSCLTPDASFRMAAHGTGGSFVKYGLDRQEAALKAGRKPVDADWGFDDGPVRKTRIVDGALYNETLRLERGDYPAFYRGMRDAILGKAENPVPVEQALAVMRVIDAGLESAATGRVVAL